MRPPLRRTFGLSADHRCSSISCRQQQSGLHTSLSAIGSGSPRANLMGRVGRRVHLVLEVIHARVDLVGVAHSVQTRPEVAHQPRRNASSSCENRHQRPLLYQDGGSYTVLFASSLSCCTTSCVTGSTCRHTSTTPPKSVHRRSECIHRLQALQPTGKGSKSKSTLHCLTSARDSAALVRKRTSPCSSSASAAPQMRSHSLCPKKTCPATHPALDRHNSTSRHRIAAGTARSAASAIGAAARTYGDLDPAPHTRHERLVGRRRAPHRRSRRHLGVDECQVTSSMKGGTLYT
jgi:hypothetical protein